MSRKEDAIAGLELLEPRLLLSAGGFFDESQWLSLAAPDAVTIDGGIASGGTDMYAFTAPATGRLSVEMDALGGPLDSQLVIYNNQGQRIRRNNNISRTRLDSRLSLAVLAGQTYYIQASGVGGTEGTYQLRLVNTPRDDCGNDLAAAQGLRLTRSGRDSKEATINYDGDRDTWVLTAGKSGTMTVTVSAGNRSTVQPGVVAYDEQGTILARDAGGDGSTAVVSFEVVAGGRYYLEATGADGSQGKYRLSYRIEDAAPPQPQPQPQPDPEPTPEFLPGAVVTGQLALVSGALQLVVLGTAAADAITLSQVAGGLVLYSALGSETFTGAIEGISVYGFDGDDVIRLDHSVSLSSWIYGGGGDDSLFDAGPGGAWLDGGEGDDLLVAVGGGADLLMGGGGLDSFWLDAADDVADASAAEAGAKAVHRISAFYQPWTTDSSGVDYVSLEAAGQSLRDPSYTSRASGYANFAHVPLFVDGPQYDDIRQGGVGDCYYLASLAGYALTDPEVLRQMIAPLGDGTYAVRFFRNNQEVYLRLDADLPVSSGTSLAYARLGADGELWVPLAEKAYAFFRYGENSYASISSGWMTTVYRELTNEDTSLQWTSSKTAVQLFDQLSSHLAAGHALTLGSISSGMGPVVGSHAYTVVATSVEDGQRYVTVYNPWGYDGRNYDGNSGDGLLKLSAELVKDAFTAVCISLA